MTFKICALLTFFMLFGIESPANDIDQYCNDIAKLVKTEFKSAKIKNKMVMSASCRFWWKIRDNDDKDVELTFEILDSELTSSQKLSSTIDFLSEGKGYEEFLQNDFWDEAFFNKAKGHESGILLLRKGNKKIKISSMENEKLIRVQGILMKLNWSDP